MEKLRETITILMDYVSAIAPHGLVGGIVLIVGFIILAVGMDRVRAKIDGMTNDINKLSLRVDSLTTAIEGRRGDAQSERKGPKTDDAEASLEEIRKKARNVVGKERPGYRRDKIIICAISTDATALGRLSKGPQRSSRWLATTWSLAPRLITNCLEKHSTVHRRQLRLW